MTFDADARAKANQNQREKYGEGYSDEMRRRAGLRKAYRGGIFPKEEMSRRAKIRWQKYHAEKQKIIEGEDSTASFDRTEEI